MRLLVASLILLLASPAIRSEEPIQNVLFLVSDDLKASVLGCYGDPICQTPNLDKLAARGMVFERAYCQGLACHPSRQSFMHSRYVDDRGPTLGEHLIANGFYSARVGKIFHMRVPGDTMPGTDGNDIAACWTQRFNCAGRESHTEGLYRLLNFDIATREQEGRQTAGDRDRMFITVEADGDGSDQPDSIAADKTIELLRQRAESETPFFIATGFVRPHYPHVSPAEMFLDYPLDQMPLPEPPPGDLDDIPKIAQSGRTSQSSGMAKYPDNIRRMWQAYYTNVTFMDQQVGRILDELERLGLDQSTAVVFTSDHGYHLGEHHFWQKSVLHEEVIRVPLIVATPGGAAGRSTSLVELTDFYPTVCDWVGVEKPKTLQGLSLQPILDNPEASIRDSVYVPGDRGNAIRTDRWAYFRYRTNDEELYDMDADPGQFTNLAGVGEFAEEKARLAQELSALESRGTRRNSLPKQGD
ncbi:MAG: sulfatase [Verrucomicrobiota bacterium]